MSLIFLVFGGGFALALAGRRTPAIVVGLVGLLLTALMFRYHLTDRIELEL